jgi:hypothetical protein
MRFFLILTFSTLAFNNNESQKPFVPDKATAIKIAEAIWLPIYGSEKIQRNKPINAILERDSIWHVYGSIPPSGMEVNSNGDTVYTAYFGTVLHILIQKTDGKILSVYHIH